ncbi:MAG: Crp/Fnr family transcriptional regulator [Thermoanaerobaculia bacterium]
MRRLVGLIEELSFTTVRGRLAMLLVRLVKSEGQTTERGHEVTLPPNQDLAAQIGTVRELVSRNLGRLQAEGLIRLDGKRMIVPDIEALAGSAEEIQT